MQKASGIDVQRRRVSARRLVQRLRRERRRPCPAPPWCSTSRARAGPFRRPRPGRTAAPGRRVIGEKLVSKRRITGHESTFSRSTRRPIQGDDAARPIVARAYNPAGRPAYGNRVLLKAVAEIINKEVKTLIAEGCKYIQLDNPHYPDYTSMTAATVAPSASTPTRRCVRTSRPTTPALPASTAATSRSACTSAAATAAAAAWHTEGGYDRIAETVLVA